jgi:hypothetical protein
MTAQVAWTLALYAWSMAWPSSVWAWVLVALGVMLLVPVIYVILVLSVTVFVPDWVVRYPSGRVRARGPHWRGDRQGPWTFWHEDGWKECEGEYMQGIESRIWTFYHPNGRACARGELDGWWRQGPWEFWDDTGHPLTEAEFLARYPRPPRHVDGLTVGRFPARADEQTVRESRRVKPGAAAGGGCDVGS